MLGGSTGPPQVVRAFASGDPPRSVRQARRDTRLPAVRVPGQHRFGNRRRVVAQHMRQHNAAHLRIGKIEAAPQRVAQLVMLAL